MKQVLLFLFLFVSVSSVESKEIFPSFPECASREFVYSSPTMRYNAYFGWDRIDSGLRSQGVNLQNRNLFDRIYHREEPGFIGYHGSTQNFRIYQDIIRFVVEELVGLYIRDDFHFFRIPGDPQFSCTSLASWGARGYDPNVFICMNYAIYGNHTNYGSSSYCYFSDNGSATWLDYKQKLVWLFDRLGIDRGQIELLFAIGQQHLQYEAGVIYQLFDTSHFDPRKPYYALADEQCLNYGVNSSFSSMVQGNAPKPFANQIRMLLNNRYTLNPHGALVVMRYDKVSPENTQLYTCELKTAVKALVFDKEKSESYKCELQNLWGIQNG